MSFILVGVSASSGKENGKRTNANGNPQDVFGTIFHPSPIAFQTTLHHSAVADSRTKVR